MSRNHEVDTMDHLNLRRRRNSLSERSCDVFNTQSLVSVFTLVVETAL